MLPLEGRGLEVRGEEEGWEDEVEMGGNGW